MKYILGVLTCGRGRALAVAGLFLGSVFFTLAFAAAEGAAELPAEHRVKTQKGALVIHPVAHATFVMKWDGKVVAVDPVGGEEKFKGVSRPDLVLITDIHGDHLHVPTLKAICGEETVIVAPPAVAEKLEGAGVGGKIEVVSNGGKATAAGISIEAIPMYNTTAERLRYHPKGRGNGYVLDLAGTRVYIAGDTEDIPEMRKLRKIDLAFLCMNLPYTMTPEQAASATAEFLPRIVVPYHYRGQDVERFKKLVAEKSPDVEVRLFEWYANR